jgi:serine/threonine-protein kinase
MADTPAPAPDDGEASVESLFADFLFRVESGESLDIEQYCAAHPQIAPALRQLHEQWSALNSWLEPEELAFPESATETASNPPSSLFPRLFASLQRRGAAIHRYEVGDLLGRGGMADVIQVTDQDLNRSLAMKVIPTPVHQKRPAGDLRRVLRFIEEAQITAQLDHPGMVPIHEMGLDDDQQLYFTMRLVRGRHLGEVFQQLRSSQEDWTLTRTLGAILKACEAVSFAHSRGVIHRDLKPQNIMVGGYGEVYVMDWGLAKVLGKPDHKDLRLRRSSQQDSEEPAAQDALQTLDGDVVGTPAYMAPEQAAGRLEEVGPAADVYSMGSILYELLAGHPPFVDSERPRSNYEIWKQVCAGPPPAIALQASSHPPELIAICERAMARQARERYPSMTELAADLRAYLEHRVVQAYRTGALAEFRKWIERNRATAASLAALLLATIVGLASTTFVQLRARQEQEQLNLLLTQSRETAERERDAADHVVDFLVGLFEAPTPERTRGDLPTAKTLLDRGAREVQTQESLHPLLRARLQQAMGRAYLALGQYDDAAPLAETAWRLRQGAGGEENAASLDALADLAVIQMSRSRPGAAQATCERSVLESRRILGANHAVTRRAMRQQALFHRDMGRHAEAEPLLLRCLAESERDLGPLDPETLDTVHALGLIYRDQGEYERSQAYLERAMEGRRHTLGADHPHTLRSIYQLAALHDFRGDYERARQLLEDLEDRVIRVYGKDHPDALDFLNIVARSHQAQGRYASAEELFANILEVRLRDFGEDHRETLVARNNLGEAYYRQGKRQAARAAFQRSYDCAQRRFGPDNQVTLATASNLALSLQALGEVRAARDLFEVTLESYRRLRGDEHPETLMCLANLGSLYVHLGEDRRAAHAYEEALAWMENNLGEDHPDTLTVLGNLAVVYDHLGDVDAAEELHLRVWEMGSEVLGEDHPDALLAQFNLAAFYRSKQRLEEAWELGEEAWIGLQEVLGKNHPHTLSCHDFLANCALDRGRIDRARELAVELQALAPADSPAAATAQRLLQLLRED